MFQLAQGLKEMDDAVALAPGNVSVRFPRGASLLTASRYMPPEIFGLAEDTAGWETKQKLGRTLNEFG